MNSLTSLSIDFHLYPSLIIASHVGLAFKCESEPVWHWKIITGTCHLKGIIKYSLSSPSSFGSTDLDLLCLTSLLSSSFFCFWKTPHFLAKVVYSFPRKVCLIILYLPSVDIRNLNCLFAFENFALILALSSLVELGLLIIFFRSYIFYWLWESTVRKVFNYTLKKIVWILCCIIILKRTISFQTSNISFGLIIPLLTFYFNNILLLFITTLFLVDSHNNPQKIISQFH